MEDQNLQRSKFKNKNSSKKTPKKHLYYKLKPIEAEFIRNMWCSKPTAFKIPDVISFTADKR